MVFIILIISVGIYFMRNINYNKINYNKIKNIDYSKNYYNFYMVKTLQLLRNIKKEIKDGEARDLTAVESAIIHIKTGYDKQSSPTTSILFSAIAIRDLGVIASSKKINLNKTNKDIIKNEIINLSNNIIQKTELL
jgi:hypothetical protein